MRAIFDVISNISSDRNCMREWVKMGRLWMNKRKGCVCFRSNHYAHMFWSERWWERIRKGHGVASASIIWCVLYIMSVWSKLEVGSSIFTRHAQFPHVFRAFCQYKLAKLLARSHTTLRKAEETAGEIVIRRQFRELKSVFILFHFISFCLLWFLVDTEFK